MLAAALVFVLFASQQTLTSNRPPLRLTLKGAIAIATEENARVRIAAELRQQAGKRVAQARAVLLPNIDAQVSQSTQTRNLAALGLRITAPDPSIRIPAFVGPFNVFDVRATALQTVFDVPAIRRYQASKANRSATDHEIDAAAEEAAASVARAYVAALRADAEAEALRENVALAEAILKQADELRAAGTGTGMEVTRAQVQLAHERQRVIVVENERRRARLQLLRTMGIDLETEIVLDDVLEYRSVDPQKMSEALTQALAERPDYRAQLDHESNTKLNASATKLERLPSVFFFGDHGSIGTSINNAFATRTYGFSANIPIFDGGRRDARRGEAASQYRVEKVRSSEMEKQIALEVKIAIDSIGSAEEEVQVAREGLKLAEAELEQAQRRYSNGVAPSLELTQSQTELARARDNLVFALFHHIQARIDLGQATGTLRNEID